MARVKFKNISRQRPGAIKGEGGGGSRYFGRRHSEADPLRPARARVILTSADRSGAGVKTPGVLELFVLGVTGAGGEWQWGMQTSQLGPRAIARSLTVHIYHTANGNTINNFDVLTDYWSLLGRLIATDTRNQWRSPHLILQTWPWCVLCPPGDQSQARMESKETNQSSGTLTLITQLNTPEQQQLKPQQFWTLWTEYFLLYMISCTITYPV